MSGDALDPNQDAPELERRFPRRLLLTAGLGAAAVGTVDAFAPGASAATTTPWRLGGNAGIASDGSDFLGPTNPAPMIFKTTASTGATPAERMRITPNGLIGIGLKSPAARVDVNSGQRIAVRAKTVNSSATAVAVAGTATAGIGVSGTGTTGVSGAGGGTGVSGTGASYGGSFAATSASGIGCEVSGTAAGLRAIGSSCGILSYGQTGVYGQGSVEGVYGTTGSTSSGTSVHGSGGNIAVHGDAAGNSGVKGESGYVGVWGQAATYGVYGYATNTGTAQTYGVFAECSNSSSFALWCAGNAHVVGTLSKSAGSFKIDHPLDPGNRWLSHSFVESPDMMNVYNGNVVLDSDGRAGIELPDYFGALNRDFRYQLTPIGAPAPVYVSKEISGNRFEIAGGTPGLKVSWQVTGIRQDDYARAHPIVVDAAKSAAERGTREFVPAGAKARRMQRAPVAR